MINDIRLKICGLTSLGDAECAVRCGADYLGFVFYPASPRAITISQFHALRAGLPPGQAVAVSVSPTSDELRAFADAGADFFQVHFPAATPLPMVTAWSKAVGPEKLWLAPKLPPNVELPAALLPLAGSVLLDTFHADKFGGTGQTGDWAKFSRHQSLHPRQTWILSGGINPDNIADALRSSGAKFVDVNSGVESAPGVKNPAKLKALAERIRRG